MVAIQEDRQIGPIEDLETVQKGATKLVPALRNLPYADRLKKCGLTILVFRRIRGDMIETYKIVTGKYDSAVSPIFKFSNLKVTSLEVTIIKSKLHVLSYTL